MNDIMRMWTCSTHRKSGNGRAKGTWEGMSLSRWPGCIWGWRYCVGKPQTLIPATGWITGNSCLTQSLTMKWGRKHWPGLFYVAMKGFPGGSVVKNPPANAGDAGLISGSGRPPGGRNSNPLLYSCLGNPMDRGACWATVHGVTKESDMT